MKSDIGTEQNDIHVDMRNVSWYGQLRGCKNDVHVLLYSVKLLQSKVKSK